MACAPLTITSDRAEVVDFTVPFATTNMAILYKKPLPGEQLPFKSVSELVESSVNIETGMIAQGDTLRCLQKSRNTLLRKLLEKVCVTHYVFQSTILAIRTSFGSNEKINLCRIHYIFIHFVAGEDSRTRGFH